MATVAMATDSTTLVLNGTAITDFIAGDILELTPVNPRTARVNGADGAVNVNHRTDAGVMDLTFRVQKYSDSDIFLSNALEQAEPVIFAGSVKEDFIKDGDEGSETYILEGGSYTTQPTNTKNNQDGNAVMEYTIQFRNATRSI